MSAEKKQSSINGSFRTIYYYIRAEDRRPIITVCLIIQNSQISTNRISRGVTICSSLDHPCKKTGRNIAFGRAIQALIHKTSAGPIKSDNAYNVMLDTGFKDSVDHMFVIAPNSYKSAYNPELSIWEQKLISKLEKNPDPS